MAGEDQIGTVADVVLENTTMRGVMIRTGGFLGIGEGEYFVPWEQARLTDDRQSLLVPPPPEGAAADSVAMPEGTYRAVELLGDELYLDPVWEPRYGFIADFLFDDTGTLTGVVIDPATRFALGNTFVVPFELAAVDWTLSESLHPLPFTREEIEAHPFTRGANVGAPDTTEGADMAWEEVEGPPVARADFIDRDGNSVGAAVLRQTESGIVLLQVRLNFGDALSDSAAGHGFHIHEIGICDAPSFESAGGHLQLPGETHGILNEDGPHAGDLPNLHFPPNGALRADFFIDRIEFDAGELGLFDDDGTALVIHSTVDDYATDPAGAAGDRIACGVIVNTTPTDDPGIPPERANPGGGLVVGQTRYWRLE